MKIIKRVILVFLLFLLTLFLLWYIGVPESYIKGEIKELSSKLSGQRANVSVQRLRKTLIPGLELEGIRIDTSLGKFLVENLQLRPNFDQLILGRLALSIRGRTEGDGEISGTATIGFRDFRVNLSIRHFSISKSEFLKGLHLRGKGLLSLRIDLDVKNTEGKVIVSGKDLQLSSITTERFYLPLNLFKEAQGVVNLKKGIVKVGSFTLSGEKIYSRLKGGLEGGHFVGSLEVMPEEGFPGPLLVPIEGYRKRKNYYLIPVVYELPPSLSKKELKNLFSPIFKYALLDFNPVVQSSVT